MNAKRAMSLLLLSLLTCAKPATAEDPPPQWGLDVREKKPAKDKAKQNTKDEGKEKDKAKEKGTDTDGKVIITRVLDKSLADRAGLLKGDTFVSINGRKIRTEAELKEALDKILVEATKKGEAREAVKVTFVVDRPVKDAKAGGSSEESLTIRRGSPPATKPEPLTFTIQAVRDEPGSFYVSRVPESKK
jgi:S1-C subfamily serine protease